MKFRYDGNFFIPNLVNRKTGLIDEYRVVDVNTRLNLILEHTNFCLENLLDQYPEFLMEEEIVKSMNKLYDFAGKAGVNPLECYYYLSRHKGNVVGARVNWFDDFGKMSLFPIEIVTNDGINYQRRVSLLYNTYEEYYCCSSIVEVEKNKNGVVVQSSYSPKVLKKAKEFIKY